MQSTLLCVMQIFANLKSIVMYVTTIAKLQGEIWAGFNMMSQFLLEENLKKEIASYGAEFQPCEKEELRIIEIEWRGYNIMIQYRRIS